MFWLERVEKDPKWRTLFCLYNKTFWWKRYILGTSFLTLKNPFLKTGYLVRNQIEQKWCNTIKYQKSHARSTEVDYIRFVENTFWVKLDSRLRWLERLGAVSKVRQWRLPTFRLAVFKDLPVFSEDAYTCAEPLTLG